MCQVPRCAEEGVCMHTARTVYGWRRISFSFSSFFFNGLGKFKKKIKIISLQTYSAASGAEGTLKGPCTAWSGVVIGVGRSSASSLPVLFARFWGFRTASSGGQTQLRGLSPARGPGRSLVLLLAPDSTAGSCHRNLHGLPRVLFFFFF